MLEGGLPSSLIHSCIQRGISSLDLGSYKLEQDIDAVFLSEHFNPGVVSFQYCGTLLHYNAAFITATV